MDALAQALRDAQSPQRSPPRCPCRLCAKAYHWSADTLMTPEAQRILDRDLMA